MRKKFEEGGIARSIGIVVITNAVTGVVAGTFGFIVGAVAMDAAVAACEEENNA